MTNTKQYYFMQPVSIQSNATIMQKLIGAELSKFNRTIFDEPGLDWLVRHLQDKCRQIIEERPRLNRIDISLWTANGNFSFPCHLNFGPGCSAVFERVSTIIEGNND